MHNVFIRHASIRLTYFILVVWKFIRVNVDDVHVGVTFFLSDLLQLWVISVDIGI